ncbi:L,D-transpeptidase [Martelella mediterranea]|uniref:L,D-transpeptidase-like protein n=1 Tax=Martelella mediterranea TaxID=293089 RepID=A0A4V2V3Y7_9HYPH|nr:L,D-transpeptidase [Martelella mediterranea]TCT36079.1 L,D-transpeptidase-like protein [Martelella mediterranea]
MPKPNQITGALASLFIVFLLLGCVGDPPTEATKVAGLQRRGAGPSLISFKTTEPPGTIVVEPAHHKLYLVKEANTALAYNVAVGREGHNFSGKAVIGRKAEWPTWKPTSSMIRDHPKANAPLATGLSGSEVNPLGARALYLYQDRTDTLYRIHGTNDPSSIGKSVSSGCIRLLNSDVIDLYDRVGVGTHVIVR